MKPLTIIVDTLHASSPVAQLLQARGAQIVPANLTVGHYLITGKCAILHITSEEFARWTTEKSVFRRITEFKRAIAEPVVVVEGHQLFDAKVASPSAIRGALAFVAVHNRVPILFPENENDAADMIYAMANQVQNGMGLSVELPTEPSAVVEVPDEPNNGNGSEIAVDKPSNVYEEIARMLPDVGPVTARALLRRFGNLRTLFTANANDLTKIDGIGPKKAKKIVSFFSSRALPRQ